jgi:hypothetical protein
MMILQSVQQQRSLGWRNSHDRKWLRLGFVFLLCMMGTGCSKKDNTSAAAPKVDICGLVTQTEMEALLGIKLKPPELQNNIICQYVSAEGEKEFKTASLLVRYGPETTDPAQAYKQYEESVKKEIKDFAMQSVDGLGVPAGWYEGFHQLALFKGKFMVIVSARVSKDQKPLDIAKKIAEKALPRLPKS